MRPLSASCIGLPKLSSANGQISSMGMDQECPLPETGAVPRSDANSNACDKGFSNPRLR